MSRAFTIVGIIILIIIASRSVARSQETVRLGFSASIGTTTESSPFGYGLGADVVAKYKLSEELAAFGSLGYTRLLTKDTSKIPDYEFIPLKAGIRVFPFISHIYTTATVGAGVGLRKGGKVSFIFGGGFGYEWRKNYDVSVKYEGYTQQKSSTTYHPFNGQFAIALGCSF